MRIGADHAGLGAALTLLWVSGPLLLDSSCRSWDAACEDNESSESESEVWRSETPTSSSDGSVSSSKSSRTEPNSPTGPQNAWSGAASSSARTKKTPPTMHPHLGLELMWMRWTSPTETEARILEKRLDADLAAAKRRSNMYPGWYVGWSTYRTGCTVTVVFHVEPEAELPQP